MEYEEYKYILDMWKTLNNIDQIEDLKKVSFEKPVAIFKHSTSCGISRMVLKNFEADVKQKTGLKTELYFLDLLEYRNISNAIASEFDIIHQSPQLIILKDGLAVHDASHHSVSSRVVI